MSEPALPSFSRRRLMCVSMVRVSTLRFNPHTSFEQRLARLHAIAALHERAQQPELERREQNLAAFDVHAVRFGVDRRAARASTSRRAAPRARRGGARRAREARARAR